MQALPGHRPARWVAGHGPRRLPIVITLLGDTLVTEAFFLGVLQLNVFLTPLLA